MGTSSKKLATALRIFADKQHGCFTATQAMQLGYADSVHLYHIKNGEWERLYRGIYRLTEIPETPYTVLMAALFWTRDKDGVLQGALFGATAELVQSGRMVDVPTKVSIAVPKSFRRSIRPPESILVEMVDFADFKQVKKKGLRLLLPKEADEGEGRVSRLSMPDYYDWLDYQFVLRGRRS